MKMDGQRLRIPTLKEFNKPHQRPAGVACDKCGAEMVFALPDSPTGGYPDQPDVIPVACPECDYRGTKRPNGGVGLAPWRVDLGRGD